MHRPLKFSIWFPIVIAAVFVVAWLWIREYSEPGPYDLEPVSIVRNGNGTTVDGLPSDEVLRGWQTYRNEEYGFEIQYPQKWFVQQPNISGTITISNVVELSELSEQSLMNEARFRVYVRKNENPQALSNPSLWFDGLDHTETEIFTRENSMIDGRVVLKVEFTEIERNYHLYIPLGKNIVEIYFPSGETNFRKTYDQILSTFKFLE